MRREFAAEYCNLSKTYGDFRGLLLSQITAYLRRSCPPYEWYPYMERSCEYYVALVTMAKTTLKKGINPAH